MEDRVIDLILNNLEEDTTLMCYIREGNTRVIKLTFLSLNNTTVKLYWDNININDMINIPLYSSRGESLYDEVSKYMDTHIKELSIRGSKYFIDSMKPINFDMFIPSTNAGIKLYSSVE